MAIPAKARLLFLICTLLPLTTYSVADTLYLKNGMSIFVNRAAEKDGSIEYWVAGTKYTISKSLVDRIETGDRPAGARSPAPASGAGSAVQDLSRRDSPGTAGPSNHDKLQLPIPGGPKQREPYWAALRNRIMQGDRVNEIGWRNRTG